MRFIICSIVGRSSICHVSDMTFLLEANLGSLKGCYKGADDSVGSTTVLL